MNGGEDRPRVLIPWKRHGGSQVSPSLVLIHSRIQLSSKAQQHLPAYTIGNYTLLSQQQYLCVPSLRRQWLLNLRVEDDPPRELTKMQITWTYTQGFGLTQLWRGTWNLPFKQIPQGILTAAND